MYATIGAGIACLFMAYQYAKPWVPGTEPAPEWAPYLFGGIGIVCLIVAGILALKLKKRTDAGRGHRPSRSARQVGDPPDGDRRHCPRRLDHY